MIGILALQGAFIEHKNVLKRLNIESIYVKNKFDFDKISALIIPGGESTVMIKLLKSNNLINRLKKFIHIEKKPVMGVCAGIIILANKEINGLNIDVERNFYGSQLDSFIDKNIFREKEKEKEIDAIYIRAPKIMSLNSDKVNILSENSLNEITGVQEGNILGFTFHPELTNDLTIHKYFLNLI